ncbi:MAG: hypothetical protein P4L28_05760 [Paludibacteraceae bacterium]|jgi:predicted RNA-binding protein with PUA domain|nr:hypothetical protein [Paludibacteraceae bacterium]
MTDEHIQLLQSLHLKIEQLKALYEKEKAKNQVLVQELEKEKKELMYAHKKMLELQTNYDNLLTAGLLSVNEDERKKAKYRLSKMVREIDKCLALLNQ